MFVNENIFFNNLALGLKNQNHDSSQWGSILKIRFIPGQRATQMQRKRKPAKPQVNRQRQESCDLSQGIVSIKAI